MRSLPDALGQFAAALNGQRGDDEENFLGLLAGSPAVTRRGLAAYRQAVRANRTAALRSTYATVAAIVGEEFFAAMAGVFAEQMPSTSGDLNDYGQAFADFLAGFAPVAELPYLPDVARLEWHAQRIYYAADDPAQNLGPLADLPAEDWGRVGVALSPAHALMASAWPLADIWRVNQPGYTGDFSVDFGQGQNVLAHRDGGVVKVEVLAGGELAFLACLSEGGSLQAAVDAALSANAACDLAVLLRRFITTGVVRRLCFLGELE